jgi:hypothetical protein
MEDHGWHRTLDLSDSQKQAEVDRVLESATFARSDQLRAFLRYVCQKEMEGRAVELNEYLVGVEALGRSSAYSPSDDSSVRSRAWELRQKLSKLYSSERNDSEVRIELPKGGYAPHYLVRDQFSDQEPPETVIKTRHAIGRSALVAVVSALAGALCVIGVTHFWKMPSANEIDPVIREAWAPLLTPGTSDKIVMANALYFLIRPDFGPGGPDRPKYPVPADVYSEYRERRPLKADARLTMFTTDNSVQMGYINGLVDVTELLQQTKVSFDLAPERVMSASEIRKHNAIFFGAPQDSKTITDLLSGGQFHFGYSPMHDIVLQKGDDSFENAPYYVVGSRAPHNSFVTYGLITLVPSLGAESHGTKTIVFSGITSVGAQGAVEFFSSAVHMRELRDHFRKEGLAGFPAAYQVVVRCKGSDTLLISFEYADSAVLPERN